MVDDTIVETKIDEVTVFQGKALVTRKGEAELEEGENTVVLEGLPLSITPDSVRVSGEGQEGTMISGVDLQRRFETEALDKERRDLERIYKEKEEEANEAQGRVDELELQKEHIDTLSQTFQHHFPRAFSYGKANIEDHGKFTDYVIDRRKKVMERLKDARKELEKAQKEVEAARGALDLSASKRSLENNRMTIDVSSKKPGPLKLVVNYMVSGASWEPVYDVRVEPDEKKVNLAYHSIVKQSTGEDWEDVAIVLSTASHTEARELPELSPWYISAHAPAPKRDSFNLMKRKLEKSAAPAPQAAGRGGAPADGAVMPEAEEVLDEVVSTTAEVEESGEAIVFKVQGRDDIPSDNQPNKLTVAVLDLNCKVDYLAVPKLTPEAYLKSRIKNETEYIFLPGKVNLFQEDDYIGATMLENVAPGEKFELSLGVARRIKVERELVKKETKSSGLLGKGRRIIYAYEIKVQNLKRSKSRFIVKDQLPVPDHEDIHVEDVEIRPKAKEIDDMKRITWKFELEPEEEKKIHLGYSVEHPNKINVYGLPE